MGEGEGTQGSFRRPSPATVISLVALFVALAGTAYALERGEVKAKNIAADAVRAKHVADDAITGAAVDESTLGPVPDADALGGLEPAEVSGSAAQASTETGSIAFSNCDLVSAVTQAITLTRPSRILVFASGQFSNTDTDVGAVEAQVELRQTGTTVANTPAFRSPLTASGSGRFDVTAVLRNGTAVEIPAGSYQLRIVLDSVPCDGSSVSFGQERLGHLVVGAR